MKAIFKNRKSSLEDDIINGMTFDLENRIDKFIMIGEYDDNDLKVVCTCYFLKAICEEILKRGLFSISKNYKKITELMEEIDKHLIFIKDNDTLGFCNRVPEYTVFHNFVKIMTGADDAPTDFSNLLSFNKYLVDSSNISYKIYALCTVWQKNKCNSI